MTPDALRRLLDELPAPAAVHRDGSPLYGNPAMLRWLGYASAGELLGASIDAVVHPDDRGVAEERVRAMMQSGAAAPLRELRFLRRDGATLVAEVASLPVEWEAKRAILVVCRDLTEFRSARQSVERAGEAVREADARFRKLLERLPDPVLVHRDGHVVWASRVAATHLGYDRVEDLVGIDSQDLVHPADLGLAMRRLAGMLETGEPAPAEEMRLVSKDGTPGVAEISALPIEFEGKLAILSIGRDVTERKRMQARLMQSDRMASIGTLAAGVAHEINNPLAYILSNLSASLGELSAITAALPPGGVAGPEIAPRLASVVELIAEARDGAERVRGIVRDLKTLSHPTETTLGRLDVRRVLDASIALVHNEIRHRATLSREYAEVPEVDGNEARLVQVFLNLVLNAVQSLGSAGDSEIRVVTRSDAAGRVVVEIADNGSGISADALPHVLEPFYTTKPPGVGTGLGLSICQSIVTQHGGELTIESAPGRGTTCRVSLRPAQSPAPRSAPPPPSSVRPARARTRVLVVDDDAVVARALRRELQRDHDVTLATSGSEALALIEADRGFDVVLLDVMMPGMMGGDLHAEVSRRWPGFEQRFVFMTGGAFMPAAREFLDRVSNLRIDKPFDGRELRRLIDEAASATGRVHVADDTHFSR